MAGINQPPRSRPPAPHLDSQVSYRLGVPLVYIRGELDHDSVGYLRETIEQEFNEGSKPLILDMSDLSYLDSGGLSLMFDIVQRIRLPQWLGIVGPSASVRRLFEITGLADQEGLRLFADLHAVSAALAMPGED